MSTFTYFGESLRYAEEYPFFLEAEFHEARTREELSAADALGFALRLAQACVHPEDRSRFARLSRANNAKFEDWVRLSRDWTVELSERPTGLPTDSSAGPVSTPESSVSVPVASVTPIGQAPEPRGDLALAVARERRSA